MSVFLSKYEFLNDLSTAPLPPPDPFRYLEYETNVVAYINQYSQTFIFTKF